MAQRPAFDEIRSYEEFIADYFIHYGDEVQTVESMALREVIRTRLRTLTMHYKEIA